MRLLRLPNGRLYARRFGEFYLYTKCNLLLSDLFHVFSPSLLTAHGEIVPHCRALQTPSAVRLHPSACAAPRGCDRLGLFLVTMHDGILDRCAAEAMLQRGDSSTANPKGAQASAGVKPLNRLYHVISLRHRHSFYSTIFTPRIGPIPLNSLIISDAFISFHHSPTFLSC